MDYQENPFIVNTLKTITGIAHGTQHILKQTYNNMVYDTIAITTHIFRDMIWDTINII